MRNINHQHLILAGILIIAGILRLYKLHELMPFVGDQAWFYLSARDMILTGKIPLVGITASRTWLHQGAYWTYILGPILWLFKFHPLVPGVFTALAGVATTAIMYFVGKKLFSARIGLFVSTLYATSPLVIISDRMPFSTSLVPLISLLIFYAFTQWVNGKKNMFPILILLVAVMHNVNLASSVLWFAIGIVMIVGFVKKSSWFTKTFDKQTVIKSIFAGAIPLIPFILYDINHGFPQTIKFVGWMVYRIFELFSGDIGQHSFTEMQEFVNETLSRMIFLPSQVIALAIFIFSIGVLSIKAYNQLRTNQSQTNYENKSILMLWVFIVVSFTGVVVNSTPSFAYVPALFPYVILSLAVFFDYILDNAFRKKYVPKKVLMGIVSTTIILIGLLNANSLISSSYFIGVPHGLGPSLEDRIAVAKKIVEIADGKSFNLVAKGRAEQFESTTMNTEYLTWWLGHGPVNNSADEAQKKAEIIFEVTQINGNISVRKL